jgi:hypothetical protein
MTGNRNFEIVYDTELSGMPERVWEAVTNGTSGWMFPVDRWPDVKPVNQYPPTCSPGWTARKSFRL